MFKEILGLLKITEEYTIDRNRTTKLVSRDMLIVLYHMQVHPSRNYISVVISSPNYTSLPSIVATFLTTCLTAVL